MEFAYRVMGDSPGFTAVVAGDTAYVFKCSPTVISKRKTTDKCYADLPVIHNNETRYVSTRNLILKKKGRIIHCDTRVTPTMIIADEIVTFGPGGHLIPSMEFVDLPAEGHEPQYTWKRLGDASSFSLIPDSWSDKWQDRILFPDDVATVGENLNSMFVDPELDPDGMEWRGRLAAGVSEAVGVSIWGPFWGYFRDFGITSAAILMVIQIFGFIRFAVSYLANVEALQDTVHPIARFGIAFFDGVVVNILKKAAQVTDPSASKPSSSAPQDQPPQDGDEMVRMSEREDKLSEGECKRDPWDALHAENQTLLQEVRTGSYRTA
jgi:hypothetical protein